MPLVEWDERLCLGIEEIDLQHREWISIINDLSAAMSRGEGGNVVAETLARLEDYTNYHFNTEEELFRRVCYPGQLTHLKEHVAFKEKLSEFRLKSNRLTLPMDMLYWLRDWLFEHIELSDKAYKKFIDESAADY